MNSWTPVKVVNTESGYFGQAGIVLRTEQKGDVAHILVKMDADASVEPFDVSELSAL